MKIVTRGGLEFVCNTTLPILEVFALEDGILIKTLYVRNLLYYEAPKSHQGRNPPQSAELRRE